MIGEMEASRQRRSSVILSYPRQQLVQRGSAALNREVAVERVYFNPFTFFVNLDNIRVEGEGEPLATLAFASFNFDPFASHLRQRWQFGLFTLDAPEVRLVVDAEGRLNVSELLTPDNDSSEPPSIAIERQLRRGFGLDGMEPA